MKFSLALLVPFLAPSGAFGDDTPVITKDFIMMTCREYCSDLVNTKLPVAKCSMAHSAGSRYAYPICIDALKRGVTAACMPTCQQIGGEAMLTAGETIENFTEAYPSAQPNLKLDCNPSDVPQVKPRFFSNWCNLNYKSTFTETLEKVKIEAVEFFYLGDADNADAQAAASAKVEEAKQAEAERIAKEKADSIAAAAAAAKAEHEASLASTAAADAKRKEEDTERRATHLRKQQELETAQAAAREAAKPAETGDL